MTNFRSLVLLQTKDVNATQIESVTKSHLGKDCKYTHFPESATYADRLSFPLTKRQRLCHAARCSHNLAWFFAKLE